jgi:hypothetical protein
MLADADILQIEELPLVAVVGVATCAWLVGRLARRRRFKEFEHGSPKQMGRVLLDLTDEAARDEQASPWP